MAGSVAGLLAFRAVVSPAYLLPINEICGSYLQTVETIYTVLLAFVYLCGPEQFRPVAAMTASMADTVSFMLLPIRDVDNPFQGDWHVSPALIVAATNPMDIDE